MRKISLGTVGMLAIVVAVAGNANRHPQTREEAMGSGFATLLMILVGVAFIIAHFIQRKRQ